MKKLILFELNEVPKEVIEYYNKQNPNSSFSYLIKKGIFRETETYDQGEFILGVHGQVYIGAFQIKYMT